MRARHLALAAILVSGFALSGCSLINTAQGALGDQENMAADVATQSAIVSAKLAIVTYQVENPGRLPSTADLETYGYNSSENVSELKITGTSENFCVQATSESGTVFHTTLEGSVDEGSCS